MKSALTIIKSPEHLKELDLNPYNCGSYVITTENEIHSVEHVLNNWDELKEETMLYNIFWEGVKGQTGLITEEGEEIKPVYEYEI